jgi:hypothetical protein
MGSFGNFETSVIFYYYENNICVYPLMLTLSLRVFLSLCQMQHLSSPRNGV